MELETQPSNSNPSSPAFAYVTAPNSPSDHTGMELYYSAPVTPRQKMGGIDVINDEKLHPSSNLDDFEFETSKKFTGQLLHYETGDGFESDDQATQTYHRDRGGSLPAMAFADELFVNGLVMPLKLPPRLQYDSDYNSFSQKSPVSSPKSPRTMCRLPFARRSSWNDDFDPFLVALQRVREEKKGRNSHHRRSRSYSPFRAMSKCSNDRDNNLPDQKNTTMEAVHANVPVTRYSGPLDFKGSAYARWVNQTREGLNPKSSRGFLFQPSKQDEQDKPVSPEGKHAKKKCGNGEESKVKKVKGFLLKYASFGRENSGNKLTKASSEVAKLSYFSNLSFKFKGNAHKKNPNKAVVSYKPSFALCLGYGVGSPRMLK